MWNGIRYNFLLGFTIECILVFFNPVSYVFFDRFLMRFAFEIVIDILLKYIGSNFAIVFIYYGDF